MKYQVWRFQYSGKFLAPTQAVGPPYATREEAEKKLAQTRKAFEVFARQFQFGIIDIPESPKQPEPPFAKVVITGKFQDGFRHPFSVFIKYECPICNKTYRVGLENVPGPGNKVIRCECGNEITLDLAFDAGTESEPEPQSHVHKGPWLKSWGYR